jgi:outer membrane protein TolC
MRLTMLKTIVVIGSIVAGPIAHALTLNEYLTQVEEKSLTYRQGKAQADGSGLVSREADLLTSPYFFAQARQSFDTTLPAPPQSKSWDEKNVGLYSAGLTQTFDFGLEAKLAYTLTKTQYENSNFAAGVESSFWDATPNVELKMPLWGNGFGRTIQAKAEVTRNQNLADQYGALANSQNLLINAEVAYWQLSTAKERVAIQEQALGAGQNIYNYVNKQKQKNLGESADVLQATALIESYKLQLQQAQNDVERAQRAFNTYLNLESTTATPSLEIVDYANLQNIVVPEARPGERFDVKAARAQTALAKASSALVLERNKPTLDVVGGYALQGRGLEASRAFTNGNKTNHDSGYVGVMFNMPLNFSAVSDAKAGARRLQESAEISEQNLVYTQDQDWIDLKQKLSESKATLKIARSMEVAQKAKLDNERTRLRQGRTTTYQVLLFEQDYTTAQAARIQSATQILALEAQLKLYQGEK